MALYKSISIIMILTPTIILIARFRYFFFKSKFQKKALRKITMMACMILIVRLVQLVINIGLAAWACPPIVRVPLVSTAIVPTVK